MKKANTSRSKARRFARERALQAIYQWDMSAGQASDVHRQFFDRQEMGQVDTDYFTRLFNGVSHHVDDADALVTPGLDRSLEGLDPIERSVLRLAVFELSDCLETPARVVINEWIEITKRFGAEQGHKYVNGVLDKLAPTIRPMEMKPRE